MNKEEQLVSLMRLLLPEFLMEHFKLVGVKDSGVTVELALEEKHVIPEELSGRRLNSHGFHKPVVIKDFPLRGKEMNLVIKRKRWKDMDSGEVLSRDWSIRAEGTRITEEFATFLKGIGGFYPTKR